MPLFWIADDVAEFAICASEVGTTQISITLANIVGVQVNFPGHSQYGPGEVSIDYPRLNRRTLLNLFDTPTSSLKQSDLHLTTGI